MMVAEGILTARGGLVQPRRRRRPRLGHARGRRCRGRQDRRARSSPSATSSSARATSSRSTAPPARSMLGERAAGRGRAAAPSSTRSSAGPTQIRKGKLGVRANADNGADAANARAVRRRGHRPVPHRAHVPRRRPPARRAPHDPRRHARRGGGRARGAARASRRPTSRRSSRRWTACRSPCACSTRRCTSSCRASRSCAIKQATGGLDGEEQQLLDGGRELARVQPDARHARRAPRRREAGPLRDAGAGADGGGGRARAPRAASPIVEIMIPLTVTREELRARPRAGSRRRSPRRPQGVEARSSTSRSAR